MDQTVTLKKKKKNKKPKEQIIINVTDSQYPVIRYVGKKMLNWLVQTDPDATNWDVWWTDGAVFSDLLGRMQPWQKVNHFPGMYSLARKNHLARNLMRMHKQFPKEYNYFPQTWLLPAELSDFRANVGKNRTFILKPEASCQGKGIILVKDAENISISEHYVAQLYVSKPLLIDGLKFDLRIYVLLAGCDPLRIYIFKEGLARFATEEYQKPGRDNLENICMHLTNYAVNKDNENFIFNESAEQMNIGHKRSMTSVFELLRQQGCDVDRLWSDIKKMMIKTFCSVQPILAHQYKSCQPQNYINNMCFEVLGMDVLLDHKFKPYLLEVNHSPSFTTDTPLDAQIKRTLISQALILMNVTQRAKQEIITQERQTMQQRVITGKPVRLSPEERAEAIRQGQQMRDEFEHANLGNFEKVYPVDNMDDDYERYMAHAAKLYEDSTGTNYRKSLVKKPQPQQQQQQPPPQQQSQHAQPQKVNTTTSFRKIKKDPSSITLVSEEGNVVSSGPQIRFASIKSRFLQKSETKPNYEPPARRERPKASQSSQGSFITPKLFIINPKF